MNLESRERSENWILVIRIVKIKINSVNLIFPIGVAIFKPEHGCIERHINNVIQVLRTNSGNVRLCRYLRSDYTNDAEPLFV